MTDKTIRVSTDVGGTFTDLVYFETDRVSGVQTVRTEKSDTTPPDFEKGVLNVLDKAGVDIASVDLFAHGTTVIINALTERKGAKVGLITTKGFRDTLEIGRGNRPDFFNLMYRKPAPFVPRHLRQELPGRMDYQGRETIPLDLSLLDTILAGFKAEKVEAIAICLLHSYANPAHESAVLQAIRERWPEIAAVASHQITREWREYERSNTTVLSAYVQPKAQRYLEKLETGLRDKGYRGNLFIMQSNCGVDSVDAVKAVPITMVESGPASGFWGAAELGRIIDEPNVLALDIGGTTAKCSLIENGQVRIKTDYWIERNKTSAGYPIMVPVVDLVEIGNGGGSIAWVDDFNKLHVGPQSAGASPGPAAYGRGGTNVTTTDANLALGRINHDYFCGGSVIADMAALDTALEALAGQLGVSPSEAARGIVRIANSNMVNALKLVSVNRGYDPRDFTLVAFGGGGAMHAVSLGQELNVKKVVIPRGAAVFSAWGMMMSDLRRDYFVTRLLDQTDHAALDDLVSQTMALAVSEFVHEGVEAAKVTMRPLIRCRYRNQEFAVEVPVISGPIGAEETARMVADFHEIYEREYTYRLDADVEIIGLHLIASSEIGKLELVPLPRTGASVEQAIKGRRSVDYATEGVHEAVIYDARKLEPGMQFAGPAIIEDPGTTIVVHPDNIVLIDDYGNTHITIRS
ncbi:hydantoinase/oxoprolinase family protein [Agrobacterium vitis]|uniref:Hydantoinase/oxoprolinase family protein n=1 Tax=Agrobacterium vitis TaxID=373 RepID=A0A368NPL7_AGRVI|nr:hydantoinase/oxoprolinase family protein [Agrobacterium vitis]KAA3506475.1 hydantoinase/oxoprolinase family protein [Agrobacterium vitis]KAA3520944.1 hydantoinase/oxoprolinase family protein [Agrobacterium vitis]MCF1479834.1 hydantoinase/oxoprolinase family protein [Agrobacterium vitis]MUZ99266.1 hydantoinase/oxoprolinase family protein [Agrobacterium vitis]MVA32670.1 hydantoinase/oxoprolinase family protein [Agrobacterium vitis]